MGKPMRCPRCRRGTALLIAHPYVPGLCCPSCRDTAKMKKDSKVYTGRKFWSQEQCYTPKELRAANEATAEQWTRAAKDNQKKIRPSLLAATGGA